LLAARLAEQHEPENIMSLSIKLEHALLSQDEIALVRSTHHPEIYELSSKQLVEAQSRLRALRSKAKTVTRHKQREAKGTVPPRGKSLPGDLLGPQKRKQLFASALKRVNKEIHLQRKLEAKALHVEAAQRALAALRDSKFVPAIPESQSQGSGMQPNDSLRRRRVLSRSKVGSVLKQNKIAQAARDAR